MHIEFIYGQFSCAGKTFDFDNLLDNSQSLTGSETTCFFFARELARRGHQVSLYTFTKDNKKYMWDKLTVLPISELGMSRIPPKVFISFNEPDYFRYVPSSSLRICFQQLNDFPYCQTGFEEFTDIFVSPSATHREYIKQFTPRHEHKWEVIHNCVDLDLFDRTLPKKKNSLIYISSPDRGLNYALQAFPEIKKVIPDATLKIYYNFDNWFNNVININDNADKFALEWRERAKYIKYALEESKDYGVSHIKSVSKRQICKEISEAEILFYPCATIKWCEGFSCSILEAMAGGAIPIISAQDALGDLYKPSGCPIVPVPISQHLNQFTDYTIRALTDEKWANEIREKTHKFAQNFTFEKEAVKLEELMIRKLKELK